MKNGNASPLFSPSVRTAAELVQAGRYTEAEAMCKKILAVQPKNHDALHLMGFAALQEGRYDEAVKTIRKAIKIKDDFPFFYNNLAFALQNLGRYAEAITEYRRAVRLKPDLAEAYLGIGDCFRSQRKPDEAAAAYEQAIAMNPHLAEAHMNLGNVLQTQGKAAEAATRFAKAAARYEQEIASTHDPIARADMCNNLGLILYAQEKFDAAETRYRQAVALNPHVANMHYNLAVALEKQGKLDTAAACYETSIALKPDFAVARSNLALVLAGMGKPLEAVLQYEQAIACNPPPAVLKGIYSNLGLALHALDRFDEALARYRQALEIDPDLVSAHCNLAVTLRRQSKLDEAITHYERAITLDPAHTQSLSDLTHQLQHAATWGKIAGYETAMLELVRRGKRGVPPFTALCVDSSPADQLACGKIYSKMFELPDSLLFRHKPGPARGKLRVGYLSADLQDHATAQLMAELFERHDRARFEISAWSYGADDGNAMRKRLVHAFDHFTDLRPLSHAESARVIHEAGIDILVDLKGYTDNARAQILAYRPAPVQVNYLGFPGTLGASFMDYIIVDPFIVPMDQQPFYSEKIVHLPHCYQPNDTTRKIADAIPTRKDCGLPDTGFVFCSFNNVYKITPRVFDIWMRLLKAVPGSVLWQLEANPLAAGNLRREAAARGVDPARLVFAPRLPLPEHLARHRLADLFLDTLPVNAHTTASDALWAGLPVVTCAGETFIGRVAGSLLKAVGLPELVTQTLEDYEKLALQLAQDPARLAALRRTLKDALPRAPLFDIATLTRDIEKAYLRMWETWQAGEPPQPFAVDD